MRRYTIKTYYTANNNIEAMICTDVTTIAKFIGCPHSTFYRKLKKSNPFEYRGYYVAKTELVKSKRGGEGRKFIKIKK